MRLEEVCLEAVDKFGVKDAKDRVIEEMSELIVALEHFDRKRISIRDLASEIADVEITLTKLKIALLDKSCYEDVLKTKLIKLKNHIILSSN